MDDGEDEQGIRHLTMEPYGLIEGNPPARGSQPFEEVSTHRE